jgi:hypothetical protein
MPNIPGLEVIQTPIQLSSPIVLLVEGKDEMSFFSALILHMSPKATIDRVENNSQQCIVKNVLPGVNIEIREVRGKDQFPNVLPLFLMDPGFPQVKAYAIIRDADSNAEATLASIQDLLKRNNQPYPTKNASFKSNGDNTRKVGIFIMPGLPALKGMLEDLCLLSVKLHPIMPHVTDFMEQVKNTMGKEAPKNESKASVQAFLSGMRETVSSLGIAAQKHYWPFDDGAFNDIRNFLEQLTQ